MLAKLTSKNQLTLPKSAVESVGATEYFDVEVRAGQIVLTPVRIQRGDAVRAKLAALGLGDADSRRRRALGTRGGHGAVAAEPPAPYAAAGPRGSKPARPEEGHARPLMKAPPRVVLDTNVVLSALLFGGGPAARVRVGWQSGRFVPLASTATAQELVRVLAYPKFELSAGEQEELLADLHALGRGGARCPIHRRPCRPAATRSTCRSCTSPSPAGRARWCPATATCSRWPARRGLCPVLGIDAFCRRFLGE